MSIHDSTAVSRVELRGYQVDAISGLRSAIRQLRAEGKQPRVLLVAPTGSGKGTIASWMISAACARGSRILFLVNRRELVKDLSRRLHRMGVEHGIIMGSQRSRLELPVQVASVDTLHRREFPPKADLIFLDEAHFSISPVWLKVVEKYPGVPLIGMTATPIRTSGEGLGVLYNAMVECPGTAELTEMGHLAPARIFAPAKAQPDLSGIKVQAGDYNQKQLAEAVDKKALTGDIVEHWLRLAKGRPTVAFAVNVEHSKHIAEQFIAAGIRAQQVDANTPDDVRDKLWADLASGRVEVCSSVGVISYGWDVPEVSCAIMARPTKSLALYLQQIGRVLRVHPSKSDALVLDHAGCVLEHGFPDDEREWSLDGARKRRKSDRETALGVRMCQQCWLAMRSTQAECPSCGWKYVRKISEIKEQEGELTEVTKESPFWRKISRDPEFAALQKTAEERGYKRGWAYYEWQRAKRNRGVA